MERIGAHAKAGLPAIVRRLPALRDQVLPAETKRRLFLWPEWRTQPLQWRVGDFENYSHEGFELNSLIYSAILYKVRAQQGAPLHAYRGERAHPEELEEGHELAKLCARPNVYQSWLEFQGLNHVYLNLAGNAYVYLDRPRGTGLPGRMLTMRPDRVHHVYGNRAGVGGTLLGFLYVPEGAPVTDGVPLLREDVIHIRLPNPLDPYEGMGPGLSPLAPLAYSGDVDNMVSQFLRTFFKEGAMVAGILTTDVPLADEEIQAIKRRWREQYGGHKHWGEIGVLGQGVSYERIAQTFSEMGFDRLDERNESRVVMPFGVPPILLGTRYGMARSTLTNYREAKAQFWNDTMRPELQLFGVEYAFHLQADDGAWVGFDYAEVAELQENKTEIITNWTRLFERGYSRRAAAEAVGLEIAPMSDDDVQYMPINLMPVGAGRPAPSMPPAAGGAAEAEEMAEEEDAAKAAPPFRGDQGPGI